MTGGGLGGLVQVVEGLEVPACGEGIVEARRLLGVLSAKVAAAEACFERAGGPQGEGFGSLAAFEARRCGLSAHESRRVARRARRVGAWPAVGEAWQAGVVSGAQVEALAGLVPERHVERFAEVAAQAVGILAPLGVHETRVALRHWVERADAAAEAEAAGTGVQVVSDAPTRELFVSASLDGVAYVRGVLDGDAAARAVATELGPQLSSVNLAQAFVAYAAWVVNGRPPRPFPSGPHVDAALLDFSATPTSVTMTYRVTSHGVARCVTGTYSAAAGAATTINDCVHR